MEKVERGVKGEVGRGRERQVERDEGARKGIVYNLYHYYMCIFIEPAYWM